MVRALICDLDDTLFPTTSIPESIVQPVVDAVRAANVGPRAVEPARLHRAELPGVLKTL